MHLSAIVAMSKNNVIGKENKLPWHLSADLQHFKKITMGKPIVMGRKTFESIGRALPGRENIVITRSQDFQAQGCLVVHSIESALAALSHHDEVFVIGGAELYRQMFSYINKLYLTIIDIEIEGDAFFPKIDFNEWQEVSRSDHAADEKNALAYSFILLERK